MFPLTMAEGGDVVFVVDDNASIRDALEGLLRSAGFLVRSFATPAEFLAQPALDAASCLVLDIELPGTNGLDLQQSLTESRPDLPVVVMTGHGDIPRSVRAMKAGAIEFLTKPFPDSALLAGIERALSRSRQLRAAEADLASLKQCYALLTLRERQVMQLVISGLINKQIASRLGTREITVKIQRGRVMQKMTASSLPDLVRMAQKLGIVPTG